MASSRAAAYSCGSETWDVLRGSQAPTGIVEIPIDGHLWWYGHCGSRPSGSLEDCALVRGDQRIGFTIEIDGEAVCELPEEELLPDTEAEVIFHLIPEDTLVSSTIYTVDCESFTVPWDELTTRANGVPSIVPPTLPAVEVRNRRGDDGCCPPGDHLSVEFEGLEQQFLDDGGYIEIAYPSGQRMPFGSTWFTLNKLPMTEGPIELTPVAADGQRGETVRVEDIRSDLVYVACSLVKGSSGQGLWILAAIAWIGVGARRRRVGA